MNKKAGFFIKSIAIVIVAALALTIRISYFHNTEYDQPIRGDAAQYVVYAQNIQEFATFSKDRINSPPHPDSYWAPGYPFFLAAIFEFSKPENAYYRVLLAQSIIGALITLFTMLLASLFLKNIWVILSGLLVAFSPHLISIGSLHLTESLFSFTLLLALYFSALSLIKRSRVILLLAAIMFGLSYLINPVMFFTPFLIAPFIYSYLSRPEKEHSTKQALNTTILFLAVFILPVSGWALRNQLNTPPDAPSSSERLLTNMIIGSHSNYYDVYRQNPRNPDNPAAVDTRNINGSTTLFLETMKERIATDPAHYAYWYLLKKPVLLWNWNILMGQGDIFVYPVITSLYQKSNLALASYTIMKSLHYWVFAFALLGVIPLLIQPNKKPEEHVIIIMLYITLFYISSVYVVTQSEARYSIPLRPEMYLCAVFFISSVFSYLKKNKREPKRTTQ